MFYLNTVFSQTDCSLIGEKELRNKVLLAIRDFENCVTKITNGAKSENQKMYLSGLGIEYFASDDCFKNGDSAYIELSYPDRKIKKRPKNYFASLIILSKKKHITFSFQSTKLNKIKKINDNEYEVDFSFTQCICYKEDMNIHEVEKRTEIDCSRNDCTPKTGKIIIKKSAGGSDVCKMYLLYIKAGEAIIR